MPHVVLVGALRAADCHQNHEGFTVKTTSGVLKAGASFLAQDNHSMLVDCLAIDAGTKHAFYALVSDRDDGVVVRLDPMTDPPKTDGVKRVLAELAKRCMAAHPDTSVGKTNLQDLLD